MTKQRRTFLKQLGALGVGAGVLSANPLLAAINSGKEDNSIEENSDPNNVVTLNILQTTDVHCQVHPHDELFWENNQAVFRKTGGYAHLATYFEREKKKNKNTFILDTGDMFQGSELSVKTTGKAMIPILNALNYDLYLPGNWEVIYYKQNMQKLMGALNAPKICANMYHDLGDSKKEN